MLNVKTDQVITDVSAKKDIRDLHWDVKVWVLLSALLLSHCGDIGIKYVEEDVV